MKAFLLSVWVVLLMAGCGEQTNQEDLSGKKIAKVEAKDDPSVPLLIPCEACGKEVSKSGEACFKCSHPISYSVVAYKNEQKKKKKKALADKNGIFCISLRVETPSARDKVIEVMKKRLEVFGFKEGSYFILSRGNANILLNFEAREMDKVKGIYEDLCRPAKLEFRIVNNDSSVRQPSEENEVWTDNEGILYGSMLIRYAGPNENPIWVRLLPSADGDIVQKASPRQDQMGGWEVGLDFTKEGGEKFATLTGDIAQMEDPVTGAPGRLAIVLDGQLESAPNVKQRIDGGSAVISGNFSYREARFISDILNNPIRALLEVDEVYVLSDGEKVGLLKKIKN
jgi:preprotein translocase subunit SecD